MKERAETARARLRAALDSPHEAVLLPGDHFDFDPEVAGHAAAVLVAVTDGADPGVILPLRDVALEGTTADPDSRLDDAHRRFGRMGINAVLTAALMVALMTGVMPLPILFMIGFAVAMMANHPTIGEQKASNVQLNAGTSEAEFVAFRARRDAELAQREEAGDEARNAVAELVEGRHQVLVFRGARHFDAPGIQHDIVRR